MAELATIARPYAEALFKAAADTHADAGSLIDQVEALAQIASNEQLRRFAENPKILPDQVFEVVLGVLKAVQLSPLVQNLLRTAIENDRVAALPEVARQYRVLVNESTGVSDAVIHSAFPIETSQLPEVVASLERRFGRKLNATVQVDPGLIGGICVVVGDEIFDASVKARLEQMKAALTA
jgi:F-type H+-transporting ATPase subunit delta